MTNRRSPAGLSAGEPWRRPTSISTRLAGISLGCVTTKG
jgi:hypothetical protein